VRIVKFRGDGVPLLFFLQFIGWDPCFAEKLLVGTVKVANNVLGSVGYFSSDKHLGSRSDVGSKFKGQEFYVVLVDSYLETVPSDQ
jgi:hypothetical protein